METKLNKYQIIWDGYTESPYKVVDIESKTVIKEFDSAVIGANASRRAARDLCQRLNGTPKDCQECSGSGRHQSGPSEQPCIHCNGTGYQLFLG